MSAPAAATCDVEVDLAAIRSAHARIAPHIHRTPVLSNGSLDDAVGSKLFFKCENLQRVAAFKARGACNAVLSLSAEEAKRGVVTHSSGNHGAALAWAARLRGIPAWIVMPSNAAQVKLDAMPDRLFTGRIVQVNPAADPQSRQFNVRVGLDNPQNLLKPGMFGRATFTTERRSGAPMLDGSPELMLREAQSVVGDTPSAIVVGPGIGAGNSACDLVRKALRLNVPAVVDADALNLIADDDSLAEPPELEGREQERRGGEAGEPGKAAVTALRIRPLPLERSHRRVATTPPEYLRS